MPSQVSSNVAPVVQIELISGSTVIPILTHHYFQSLEITERAVGSFHGVVQLFDPTYDFLEGLVLAAGSDRFIRLRWGWDELGLSAANVPTVTGFIVKYTPEFMPHGIQLTIELISGNAKTSMLDRLVRSFPEQTRVSDIVQAIADERGWTAFIEGTDKPWPEPLSSAGESDVAFIKALVSKALSPSGEGGYVFYFDVQDRLHFHTTSFAAEGSVRSKQYIVARDNAGEVLSFAPSDSSFFAAMLGAGKSVFRATTSTEAAAIASEATVETGLNNSGTRIDPSASAWPDFGSGIQSFINFVTRHKDELDANARARYEEMRRITYPAKMETIGTHDLRVLDFVDVQYIKPDGQPHYLSGQFRVLSLKHRVDAQGWRTEFDLARSGRDPGAGTVPLSGASTLQPEVVAP